MEFIKVKRFHPKATFKKAHPNDEGYDLTACGYEYKGNGLWYIKLGIAVEPPAGFYFEVVPRSSFSKKPFRLANDIGIIDRNYRGEIMFPVRHITLEWFNDQSEKTLLGVNSMNIKDIRKLIENDIEKYLMFKRIAQAIPRRIHDLGEAMEVDELSETQRGANGLGSSGA